MFRLVAYAPDGVQRFPINADEMVIGSEPHCDVFLPYSGVAQRHARLFRLNAELHIEDLGSRKGMLVSGRRVKEASLGVLDEIRLGGVTLLVEDVIAEGRPEPQVKAPPPAPPALDAEGMIRHLARVSDWVLADAESRITLESLMGQLMWDFGGGLLVLFQGELEEGGVKFVVASDPNWLPCAEDLLEQIAAWGAQQEDGEVVAGLFRGTLGEGPAWICVHRYKALERSYFLVVALPRFDPEPWSPVPALRALGDQLILGLVHHVGHYEPILPGKVSRQNLVLDPGLTIGESASMQQLVEQLKAAVDPPVQVLLLGEAGSGRELLARSLHLSSHRRSGPFVSATCGGTKPEQVEADLFGAEIAGKGEPVRRQGKISLADAGTLYLEDVDQLPLELQARLVRFLRSSEVEPNGSSLSQAVDVRLVVSSREALDALVARDLMRVDLAYRLSGLTLTVPPVRQRREDLPLLIQGLINRFCHQTGKRVQGIAVRALNALLSYDYPGNLPELENITRQLVYLCAPGKPIDINLLPERVRISAVRGSAVIDRDTELNLERLIADCERAALREALRRSHGNKSQAARELGLSRNGLAMKIARHGIKL